MRTLPIDRPTLDDPLYSQQNPHQTFLLVLSVLSAIPLLRGQTNSALLERELTPTALIAWGACLGVGSAVALVGQFWRGHTWTALGLERAGVGLVGAAIVAYTYVIVAVADDLDDVAYVTSIQTAYAAACLWRVAQITRRRAWLRKLIAELNTLDVRTRPPHPPQDDGQP